MLRFREYREAARKPGPDPYWTPVVPLHRFISFPTSYLYALMRLAPLTVTLWGLLMTLVGFGLFLWQPQWGVAMVVGVALMKYGITHDYCDGELARYRISIGKQSPKTYRVGIFADIWAYTIVIQSLLPAALGLYAWRAGAPMAFAWTGIAAGAILLFAYPVGLARGLYWPERAHDPLRESFSFARDGPRWLYLAGRAYFYVFETAVLTTHMAIVLLLWAYLGGTPAWALWYVGFVQAGIGGAFLVGIITGLRGFDRP